MSPDYAVITACLNAGSTIADTLRSVLSQTPPPRQFIVVDGGSQDDTLERVEAARLNLPAASAFRLETQRPAPGAAGIPAAWNQALRLVAGEPHDAVFILNADDWYEPGAAAAVLKAFAEHPHADIVTAAIQYRAGPGAPVLRRQQPRSLR